MRNTSRLGVSHRHRDTNGGDDCTACRATRRHVLWRLLRGRVTVRAIRPAQRCV